MKNQKRKQLRDNVEISDNLLTQIDDYGMTESSNTDDVVYGESQSNDPMELVKPDEIEIAIRAIKDLKKDHLQEK